MFLPFGQGPSPGWRDWCVQEPLRVAVKMRPSLRVVGFADDLRLVVEPNCSVLQVAGALPLVGVEEVAAPSVYSAVGL